jgi:LysM repeat protein
MKKNCFMLIVAGLLASCSQPPAQVVNKGHNVYAKTGTIQLVLVKEGQTLKSIARNHSITPEKLLNANGLKAGSEVLPGMSLIIPVSE